ncbi:MAG: hypothetical protein IPN29_01480 [Saprospiraceae bacterium]|nr:hypothetical protein [Saprospiraceae bacterium]
MNRILFKDILDKAQAASIKVLQLENLSKHGSGTAAAGNSSMKSYLFS